MKTKLLVLMLLFCLKSVYSQTITDIEKKYGKRQDVYSVSEHIWMTPDYTVDRQVCRVRLYAKRVDAKSNYLGATLQYEELRDVLNSLIPPDSRGQKTKLNFGATATGGPAAWTTYPYERVVFTFVSSFRPSFDSTVLKRGEFVFQPPEKTATDAKESSAPSVDDFLPSASSDTEVVTIRWNDRKCAGH
jgi:hypothetical protein